jgi:DNA-binding response OmpR family regulator
MERGGSGRERTMRILVVEDERKVASFIRQGLEEEGYAVDVAPDGATAVDLALGGTPYDLVVLDVMLPKRDGFAVLRDLREHRMAAPVLMLTARDRVPDRVTGLDLGADDYLTKPFVFDEFLARVRALLRRAGAQRTPTLQLADLRLDPATRQVTRGSRTITLTAREYALLEYFLRNVGRVLTRPMLAEHVWGIDFDPESNVIDVYVGYLRRKIDLPGETRLLHTTRGTGYVMRVEP